MRCLQTPAERGEADQSQWPCTLHECTYALMCFWLPASPLGWVTTDRPKADSTDMHMVVP